jgi:flagellar hook-length control protein FliK
MLAAVPPADELATAVLPAAAGASASDQTGRSAAAAPPLTTAASSGMLSPATALGPVNPVPPTAEIHVGDQPAGNAASSREAESIPLPLPVQVAVKFATAVHADDGNTSDSGTDILAGFAGGRAGGSTPTSSEGQTGAAIQPSFNPTMQAAPIPPMAPQHAAGMLSAVPLAGIPIAIIARAEAGEKKFEIRLDPPDLGRIEVQLNVDASGRATSHLIVDRADTLDLLRRDAPALERALQSAGLTTDEGALQFSLRDQSFAGRDQGAPAPFTPPPPAAGDSDLAPIDTALRRYGPPMGLGGGIDIRV